MNTSPIEGMDCFQFACLILMALAIPIALLIAWWQTRTP